MKSVSRSRRNPQSALYLGLVGAGLAGCLLVPPSTAAQAGGLVRSLELPRLLLRSNAPGYMGVLVGDVDPDSAAKFKLRDTHGALVTLIDHDAPAAQAGIRVNDVVVELNDQRIDNSEQFSRVLRALPAGRKVKVIYSREGGLQTVTLELADRKKMEHDVWNKLDSEGGSGAAAPAMGILSGGGSGDVPSGGFHMPFFGSTLNVGAIVEPLGAQMAEYLGVKSGLVVKQVTRKSEAAAAGLKPFDVILKVGPEVIATTADWDRTLRANQNKTVPVTVLRDRRQQVLTLQVDSRHRRSALEPEPPQPAAPWA